MQLTKLSFERYKCFPRREELEIRPLTVLIGRNSSGKSVIARLPLLLRHSLSSRAIAPVDLEVDGLDFGASFVDLVHGRNLVGSIGLGFEVAEDSHNNTDNAHDAIRTWIEIQHIDEPKLQVVKKLAVTSRSGGDVRFEWTGTGDPVHPRYLDQQGREHLVEFAGFRARGADDPDTVARLTQLMQRAETAFENVRYLGPFREIPRRQYRYPGRAPRDVGAGGGQAPAVLGAYFSRKDDRELVASVGKFYVDHLGGWKLDVDPVGDSFALVLDRGDGGKINLVDVGVGLSQVLPLVVQRYLDAHRTDAGYLEIIEQPELHLHPGAHAAVADLYIDAVANTPNARFIIETHAEIFLLRIRRRIAEGKLDPGQVAVYWLRDESDSEQLIMPIPIGDDGEVEVWPTGVFSEDFAEVKAIERARKAAGR